MKIDKVCIANEKFIAYQKAIQLAQDHSIEFEDQDRVTIADTIQIRLSPSEVERKEECDNCSGTGKVTKTIHSENGDYDADDQTCHECGGKGTIHFPNEERLSEQCQQCNATGKIEVTPSESQEEQDENFIAIRGKIWQMEDARPEDRPKLIKKIKEQFTITHKPHANT